MRQSLLVRDIIRLQDQPLERLVFGEPDSYLGKDASREAAVAQIQRFCRLVACEELFEIDKSFSCVN